LNNSKSSITIEQLKLEADVGPLKYVAELIYGDNAQDHFDSAVRIIILILIFVFDPLAVLLLIAANISLRQWRMGREEVKSKKKDNLNTRIKNLVKKNDKYKKKQAVILKALFGSNASPKDLEKMNPDEIKIKMNQIMDMNKD